MEIMKKKIIALEVQVDAQVENEIFHSSEEWIIDAFRYRIWFRQHFMNRKKLKYFKF